MKILDPTPSTYPSLTESRASEVTAFEKPVIGTRVPAPAHFAILSKSPIALNAEASIIRDDPTSERASFSLIFKDMRNFLKSSPKRQIKPPKINAKKQFLSFLVFGVYCLIISFLHLVLCALLNDNVHKAQRDCQQYHYHFHALA